MNYFIKSEKKTDKETTYELSEPFTSQREAEEKLAKMHKAKRDKSSIVAMPSEIRDGLVLRRNNKYYKTIIASSRNLWFAQVNLDDKLEVPDPIRKEKLIDYFATGVLDSVEEYNDSIEFKDVQDVGNFEINSDIKDYGDEE